MSPALASEFFTTSTTWEAQFKVYKVLIWYIYKLKNDYHHLTQMDMNLSKLQDTEEDREAWCAAV